MARRSFSHTMFIVIALLLLMLCIPAPGTTQLAAAGIPVGLQGNAKFIDAEAVLADFKSGAAETGVIVLLRSSSKANDLAAQSATAQAPNEFKRPGAPTFYNLRDKAIREQLRATVTETVALAVDRLAGEGLRVTQHFAYQFGFAARVTPDALQRIVDDPEVVSVEKDRILQPHLAQGIPLMSATTPRTTYTGSGLSIAICDTGIDTSHSKLGGGGFPNTKVIGGYDTGDSDADPRPDSLNGEAHGTACAGIAAGNTGTTGDYIGGVAPGAKLYALKISTGTSGSAFSSAMIAGWEWAVTHQDDDPNNPIMIISTSFGGGKYSSSCDSTSPSMTTAAANAVATGITVFVSSGNDGYCNSMGWPACISYVNSVGAVYDASLGTYGFCVDATSCATKEANAGCSTGWAAWDVTASDKVTSYSNSASFLTLVAPSNDAYTTDIVGTGGYAAGDYDTGFGGTSAACPYAAGAAAVLQSAAIDKSGSYLTPAQVKQYLVNNGDNVTDPKVAVTKPRINLANSVAALPVNYTLTVNKDGTGSGTVTSTPSGINCGSDCSETYSNSTLVTLTYAADSGSTFSGWSGACTGTGICSVTMNQARSVTATFIPSLNKFTVTVNASGSGGGVVTSSPGEISYSYPATSSASTTPINQGTSVTLSANANSGSTASWDNCTAAGGTVSGNGSSLATCTFSSLDANKTGTATFTLNTYTVTANAAGSGAGTVSSNVGGINYTYPTTSTATTTAINHGSSITLSASANIGSTVSWSGCSSTGGTSTAATCTFSGLDANKTVTATFAINTYTVTPSAGANGSIFPSTPQTVNHGLTTGFTVTPDLNSYIDHVNGCGGNLVGNIYTTGPIMGDCLVSATFAIYTYELIVNITGKGLVTSNPIGISCNEYCSEMYDNGTVVTLIATPQGGSTFVGWSGDCVGTDLTCDVTVDQQRNVSAEFTSPFPWPMFMPAIQN